MLGKQLHIDYYGVKLTPEATRPITNQPFSKASGGLWTSTYEKERGSDWVQWCLGEQFNVPDAWNGYILTPSKDAKILTIDTFDDLAAAFEKYPWKANLETLSLGFLDYEKISQEYDAMRLTERGQWATRLTFPISLYGWDCESTHWFRWKFDNVEELRGAKFK